MFGLARAPLIALAALALACSSEPTPPPSNPAGTSGSGGSGGTAMPDAASGGSSGRAGGGSGGVAGDSGSDASADSGGSDGSGGCREFVMPTDCTIPPGAVLPGELRCTGLYGDWEKRELACGVMPFKPAFELWSDAADKHRYIQLPAGTTIDVTDPDGFRFPTGTQLWKEFRLPVDGGTRLGETRLLRKSADGWIYTSYVWSADERSTVQTNEGVANLHATEHTVPTRDQCRDCHVGRSDFVLGWDFVLLGEGASGLTLSELARRKLLAMAGSPVTPVALNIPGDDVERAALGYLHANCGVSCHNETGEARGKPSGLFLRLEAADLTSVHTTDAVKSGINRVPSPNAEVGGLPPPQGGPYYDLRPLDPARSLSLVRMDMRGTASQMPRIGTNRIDAAGVSVIKAWIQQMTPARGYPAAAP
jgi:hypothetical protein